MKTKTKINWKKIAQQAFEVGRRVARSENNGVGYDRPWILTPEASKKGYVAFAQFVAKAVKNL